MKNISKLSKGWNMAAALNLGQCRNYLSFTLSSVKQKHNDSEKPAF